MIELRKSCLCESLCRSLSRGRAVALKNTTRRASPGLERPSRRSRRACANGQLGSPRNLGDPVVSTDIIPDGDTGLPTPGLRGCTCRVRAKARVRSRGIAERRQRSDARRTAGSHSVLIVPWNSGNGTQPDPTEGSETPNHGTVFEKHIECIEIRKLCPRNRDG